MSAAVYMGIGARTTSSERDADEQPDPGVLMGEQHECLRVDGIIPEEHCGWPVQFRHVGPVKICEAAPAKVTIARLSCSCRYPHARPA